MKKELNRSEVERLIHLIAVESGQLVESIQWEHEAIQEHQLNQALITIEEKIKELKEILGE